MTKSVSKLIVGTLPYVQRAGEAWQAVEPDTQIIEVCLEQDSSYNFDLNVINTFNPSQVSAFVAMGDQFLNVKRMEVFQHLREHGFSMPCLIPPGARIHPSVQLGQNVWLEFDAMVGSNSFIGHDTYIGEGAFVQTGCHIEDHVTILAGAKIGHDSIIEGYTTIGTHVTLVSAARVGAFSRIIKPATYQGHMAEGSFLENQFSATILC